MVQGTSRGAWSACRSPAKAAPRRSSTAVASRPAANDTKPGGKRKCESTSVSGRQHVVHPPAVMQYIAHATIVVASCSMVQGMLLGTCDFQHQPLCGCKVNSVEHCKSTCWPPFLFVSRATKSWFVIVHSAARIMDSDDESSEDEFLAPAKKVQKQGSGANAASKPRPGSGGGAQGKPKTPSGVGGSNPSSVGGSRPGSAGGSGKPAVKARPLVASTQRVSPFPLWSSWSPVQSLVLIMISYVLCLCNQSTRVKHTPVLLSHDADAWAQDACCVVGSLAFPAV